MLNKKWPLCQVCQKPVTTEQGILAIYNHEINEYKRQLLDWEKQHPEEDNGTRILSSKDLAELPLKVPWHWGHAECLQEYISYRINYTRFDTVEKALGWTLHLMEKTWLRYTNWNDTVKAHYEVSLP